ncbi:MAG: hypothetical protein FJ267_14365 [Planctomycetes bacterium]|nr:hypothetical protein [Planctomycetota bacterium]
MSFAVDSADDQIGLPKPTISTPAETPDNSTSESQATSEAKQSQQKHQVEEFLDKALGDTARIGDTKVMYLPFASQAGRLESNRPISTGPDSSQSQFNNTINNSPVAGSSMLAADPSKLDPNSTDTAAAIRSAAGAMPPDYVPKIVLLTDGNQTSGDALQAALGATFQGGIIPIDTVPLKTRDNPEVQVAAFAVPAQVINANHDDEGLVEVFRGAHKVLSENRSLKSGENRFRFQQSITGERLAQY